MKYRSWFGSDNYHTFMKVLEKCYSVLGFVILTLVHILLEIGDVLVAGRRRNREIDKLPTLLD